MSEDVTRMTDEELAARAQGCTETTCLYHGVFNAERRRRLTADPAPATSKGGGDRG